MPFQKYMSALQRLISKLRKIVSQHENCTDLRHIHARALPVDDNMQKYLLITCFRFIPTSPDSQSITIITTVTLRTPNARADCSTHGTARYAAHATLCRTAAYGTSTNALRQQLQLLRHGTATTHASAYGKTKRKSRRVKVIAHCC